jgi:pimeloyl-ACP methyl ester carboxylesterase
VSLRGRVLGAAAGIAGVAVAGTAAEVLRRRRVIARRGAGREVELGSLRSDPRTVVAGDGVPLHVEVDEVTHGGGTHAGTAPEDRISVVFVHGYALNLDSWHFQRAGYRGLVRAVYYDHRSHGRSGRSTPENSSIDQLGDDLRHVMDQTVPDGRVVLVGHSMGGMAILALAEDHPELFGSRVVGVGLISTTAGGLSPHRLLLPRLPRDVGGEIVLRLVAGLARTSRVVDGMRRVGRDLAMVLTDAYAFGDKVPPSHVEFVDRMLSGTPFEVIAEFFPHFDALDKFAVLEAFERIPTTIICGTEDKVTSIGHSRKLHALVAGSRLVECEGAGHLVTIERHGQVNAALDQLFAAAAAHVPTEPE